MISFKNDLFHLHTNRYSCLLRITARGQIELIHYGAPVSAADAEALACKPGLGWGSSVELDETERICLDILPLAWSGSGRGDYRETPVELEEGPTDFHYVSHRMGKGIAPMCSGLPQAKDGRETLEIKLAQENGMEIRFPAMRWCTDNAAMIGAAGFYRLMRGEAAGLDLNAMPSLRLV